MGILLTVFAPLFFRSVQAFERDSEKEEAYVYCILI